MFVCVWCACQLLADVAIENEYFDLQQLVTQTGQVLCNISLPNYIYTPLPLLIFHTIS